MSASTRLPLVVVLGATGSGKSKLALEIGRLFNGEIISADSMQIYKGLDIVTNKVTREELQQCPHHMINYLDPLMDHHTVVDYRDMAVPIIDRILKSQKIPIIVGGTNYYIEALMWKFLINKQDIERAASNLSTPVLKRQKLSSADITENDPNEKEETSDNTRSSFRESLEGENTVDLYKKLMEIDRKQGEKIHPHNRRKIIRALEVYQEHGIEMSKILESQKSDTVENDLRGELRYHNTCVFWIQADRQVLDDRTDKRVDEMIERGLVTELQDFHKQYNASRLKDKKEVDYTHGIFQSIGFKEFHEYLVLEDADKNTEKGKQLLEKGIEEMKMVTRRYARKQVQWIRNRLLTYRGSKLPPVYGLDSTDVSKWEECVHKPAVETLTSILQGKEPDREPLPLEQNYNVPAYNVCDVCNLTFTMENEWQAHIKGRRHNKLMRAKRKREIYEEYKRIVKEKETEQSRTGKSHTSPLLNTESNLESVVTSKVSENVEPGTSQIQQNSSCLDDEGKLSTIEIVNDNIDKENNDSCTSNSASS